MKIISRAEAKASGATRYFTNKPCKHGHIAERQVSNSTCFECSRLKNWSKYNVDLAASRAKRKAYYEANKSMILAINKASNIRNEKSVKMGKKRWYDRVKQSEEWQNKQKELRMASVAIKQAYDKKYRAGRPARNAENSRNWILRNPEKRRAIAFNYKSKRCSIERAGDPTHVIFAWVRLQEKVCFWCGVTCEDGYHVDHFNPLARGGEHRVTNLRISCPSCNLRKNARDPYEFAAEVGKFL